MNKIKYDLQDFKVFYKNEQYLNGINLQISENEILGVIGPSGSGKTTFLRALNRMNELDFGFSHKGKILLDGVDIYEENTDLVMLRRRVGVVFALPVALPLSIYENIVYGPRLTGKKDKKHFDELVEKSLKKAFLWEEVKDRLNMSGLRLSGGQQQRLCLARVLAMEPDVILLDEPCSGLDPISTSQIEDALVELKNDYTIILVTNNTMQAARVSDKTAFFLMGDLVEVDDTKKMFTNPGNQKTSDYITGRFG